MRWKPETDTCSECGFSWLGPVDEAITLVETCPARFAAAVDRAPRPTERPAPGVWSAGEYVWHLVDVLRIGAERLWTLELEPAAGVPCWDEKALAEVRRYAALSPRVGLRALADAASTWSEAARTVDRAARTDHALFGSLSAADVIRRNAHEAHHHLLDLVRG